MPTAVHRGGQFQRRLKHLGRQITVEIIKGSDAGKGLPFVSAGFLSVFIG
jgi:hypothetical protein